MGLQQDALGFVGNMQSENRACDINGGRGCCQARHAVVRQLGRSRGAADTTSASGTLPPTSSPFPQLEFLPQGQGKWQGCGKG